MIDNRNLIVAIVLSLAILLGFEYLVGGPQREQLAEQQRQQQAAQLGEPGTAPQADPAQIPAPPGGETGTGTEVSDTLSRDAALRLSPRVTIDTPTLRGSIALKGGRLDDLVLTHYRETIDPTSPRIELLSPAEAARPYFADFGWSSGERSLELPDRETLWQANGTELTPGRPVTLSWTNSQGITFEKIFSLDQNYMFTVTQRVENRGGAALTLSPFGLVSRTGHPDILGFYILHEGLIGVFDETLEELDYSDLEEKKVIQQETTGGWIGITDKYWLVALVPDQQKPVNSRFVFTALNGPGKYQTDFLYDSVKLAPGSNHEVTSHLFAGAKQVLLLDKYQEDLGIARFDRAVDFGWFYFLTKPFFYMLHYFAGLLGNFGLAILAVTVIVKLVFFPLANKSYRAMAKMRKLQPEMKRLQERFKEDKQRLNQEMMTLYKKEGANPMSGCLPILVQIPVFFALYKVLFVSIEMRQAPFYGWIHDLSAPDPTSILNGFGLFPWTVPDLGLLAVINIGVWPIVMGVTMVLQHRLNPQPTDPLQAKIFTWMPVIFTFLLAQFPAGLVIYWTWNNVLSILQQAVIMKRAGVPIGRQPSAQTTPLPKPQPAPSASGNQEQPSEPDVKPERAAQPEAERRASTNGQAQAQSKKNRRRRKRRRGPETKTGTDRR